MKTTTRIATALAATAAAASLASGATLASSAPAQADSGEVCDLTYKVDELDAWDTEDRYNIIVYMDSAHGESDLNGVAEEGSFEANGCGWTIGEQTYHYALFEDGTFTRSGDGGYRNWAFRGSFDRVDDTHVVFHKK